MPPLGLHMIIARDLAGDISSPRIDADRGAYYLGATTPDIRVLTRWDRERTHFFRLEEFGEQSGVHRLFETQPHLRHADALDAPTASFVAGYISHLVMDEAYICQIYRPAFGERSPLAGDALADVMDRALQHELDRQWREDEKVEEIAGALAESAVEVAVEFIARDTLLEWRDVSLKVLRQPLPLVRTVARHVRSLGFDGEEAIARFMDENPAIVERSIEHVGEERIREYLYSATARARRAIKEYIS